MRKETVFCLVHQAVNFIQSSENVRNPSNLVVTFKYHLAYLLFLILFWELTNGVPKSISAVQLSPCKNFSDFCHVSPGIFYFIHEALWIQAGANMRAASEHRFDTRESQKILTIGLFFTSQNLPKPRYLWFLSCYCPTIEPVYWMKYPEIRPKL